MFSIYDGRESFYQWDLDRKIIVEDNSIKEVHFCNKTEECSLVVETYTEDGVTLANVPNILLTTDWKIRVYGYTGDFTKYEECFRVNKRSKPADYIYTETELKSYEDLEQRIEALEQGGTDEETEEKLTALETAIGDITEASYLFPKATITNGKYTNESNEYIEQEDCSIYSYSFGGNWTPDGSENRILHIKTYMYGDMAICGYCHWYEEEFVVMNDTADIENNPESGIIEYDLELECFFPWGTSDWVDVSFCENPYMDKPEVEIKTNVWKEIQDIRNNAVTYDYLSESGYATYDDIYYEIEDALANFEGGDTEELQEQIEELAEEVTNASSDAGLALEMAVDAQNQCSGYGLYIEAMTNYNYNEDGLATGYTDWEIICRYKKKITLTSNNQSVYIPLDIGMDGDNLHYFYAMAYDGNYNTRVANYTIDGDGICNQGIIITLKSDIPSGTTAEIELQALFAYKEYMDY